MMPGQFHPHAAICVMNAVINRITPEVSRSTSQVSFLQIYRKVSELGPFYLLYEIGTRM
jgi:hypothetical protein